MGDVIGLSDLGPRIAILGPSNSGKSTLAHAIGAKLGIPVLHVDQFRHLPGTDWVQRSDDEFKALHDAAILGDAWVMDGNYTALLPQRLARATGMIVIDDHFLRRYLRYFRRTLGSGAERIGGLEGGRDSIKWEMVAWIWKTRNAQKYREMAERSGLPHVVCRNQSELDGLYQAWGLTRQQ